MARRTMIRSLMAGVALALLAGCGHGSIRANSSGGLRVGVDLHGSSDAMTLLAIGVLAGMAYHSEHPLGRPEMEPARTVHEQDCSKPIENPGANLRCR